MFSRAGTLRLLLALDAGALGSDCIALALTRLDDPVTAVPITRVALPSLEEATLEASYPAVAIVLCPAAGWRPEALYLDNGSTYTGEVLATLCSRLSIGLLHASPYDPQARGKMERFWRTLREGCLDHLGTPGSLHDVPVRLLVFLGKHYHVAPHASLMGKSRARSTRPRLATTRASTTLRSGPRSPYAAGALCVATARSRSAARPSRRGQASSRAASSSSDARCSIRWPTHGSSTRSSGICSVA